MAKIGIFNALTNENTILEVDDAKFDADAQAFALSEKERIAAQEARAAQKAALLDRLGITEDEAKLLLA
jgi:hypothetical protein